jgi:hypothetical protein
MSTTVRTNMRHLPKSTLGGLVALLGDVLWLATDAVLWPLLHWPRWPFFCVIGVCFAAAIALLLQDMRRR